MSQASVISYQLRVSLHMVMIQNAMQNSEERNFILLD